MNTLFHFRLFVIINIAIINSAAKVTLFFEPATTYHIFFAEHEPDDSCANLFFGYFLGWLEILCYLCIDIVVCNMRHTCVIKG